MTIASRSRILIGTIAVCLASPGLAQTPFDAGAPPGSPGREIYTVDHLTPRRLPRMTTDGGINLLPDWLESLRRIEQLDFDYVSPGHESVGTKADVSEQVRYMRALIEAVSAAIAAGKSEAETVKSVRLEQFSHLMEYERSMAGNVAVAYRMLSARRGR